MENVEAIALSFQPHCATSDDHSYSEPDKVRIRHIDLDLRPSFERQVLQCSVVLSVEKASGHLADALILDTRGLEIHSVEGSVDGESFRRAKWETGSQHPILGAALTIQLLPRIQGADHIFDRRRRNRPAMAQSRTNGR